MEDKKTEVSAYKPSKELIEHLKKSEGFRNGVYTCPAGYWSIGYGSRYDLESNLVTWKTKPISQNEGDKLLYKTVLGIYADLSKRNISMFNDAQIDAFIELAFNIGLPTLVKTRLFANAQKGVNLALEDWTQFCYYRSNGKLIESKALKQRRIFCFNMYSGLINPF
jgi:lysozyme